MFVWGRNIYLVQLLSAATPGMTSPVRKRVPVGQICNRLQAQMDSETGTTSTPLSPTQGERFVVYNLEKRSQMCEIHLYEAALRGSAGGECIFL